MHFITCLNCARNNLFGSVQDDVDFAQIQKIFLFVLFMNVSIINRIVYVCAVASYVI